MDGKRGPGEEYGFSLCVYHSHALMVWVNGSVLRELSCQMTFYNEGKWRGEQCHNDDRLLLHPRATSHITLNPSYAPEIMARSQQPHFEVLETVLILTATIKNVGKISRRAC